MEHQELYDYMEHIVKRYFKFYRLRYLNASIEFEDLIQEAHLVTALLLDKIKKNEIKNIDGKVLSIDNFIEVKRFIGNAVGRKLNTIRRWRTKKGFGNRSGEKICDCDYVSKNILEDYCLNCGRPVGYANTTSLDTQEEDMVMEQEDNFPLEEVRMRITLDEMAKVCLTHPEVKQNDFRMFCEKHVDRKTLQEIGNKYHVCRERVRQKIERVTEVLQRYFS